MLLILVQVDGPKTRKGFASGCNRSQRMFCALLIDEHISMQHHGSLLAIYRSTNSEVLKYEPILCPGYNEHLFRVSNIEVLLRGVFGDQMFGDILVARLHLLAETSCTPKSIG